MTTLRIGREPDCDVVLDSPLVSRYHAELQRTPDGVLLRDLGSANGTYVDGQRVQEHRLQSGEQVYLGNVRFVFDGKDLREEGARGQVRLEVHNVFFRPPSISRDLLQRITATIEPGQFVAIVGTSGAGKSTMMNLLSGQRPPTQGRVTYNGLDASQNIDVFRAQIGFVPQDDIVHRELSVEAALRYSGQLRLPPDTSPNELQRRIDAVLASVELSHRRHNAIFTLSGGERKRVSMAVELLTEPSLFFLDEPTSGLDPGMEKKAMQMLNRLSRQGRTVVLITHATQNIVLCDRVLLLSPGGRMVYYGPPRQALQFFEVEDFADIYLKIDSSEKGQEWEERFRTHAFYAQYAAAKGPAGPLPTHTPYVEKSHPLRDLSQGFRQLAVLSKRYVHLLISDRANLTLLVLQAPLIGLILAFLFDPHLFDLKQEWNNGKYPVKEGPTVMFLMMVSSLFFGSINSCREVVKEMPILRRERLVSLQLLPYFMSKVLVLSVIGVAQSFLLCFVVSSRIPLQLDGVATSQVLLFLGLSAIGGTLIGLLLSCISVSAEQSSTLVSVVLIVQLALSGAFIKPEEMLGPVRFSSILCLSRWTFGGIGSVSGLNTRFMNLQMGWITSDFYITWTGILSVLLPLLAIHGVIAFGALRWRETRQER